jgi:two-component system LytT family sensor kinase
MHVPENRYFKWSLAKTNLVYGLVGQAVGLIICLFVSAINNKLIPLKEFIASMIFSAIITLSITNSIYLVTCIWSSKKFPFWQFVLIFYGCSILGTLIGVELSYLVMSIIFHVPYHFLSHFNDYRFNLLIVLVVSTIIYFYMSQKGAMNAKLREKELDLVKAKQLITQAELQTLQSKINPHFLYNSLNAIAGLVHEDADKAEDMTLKLSRLFRYSINSPQENTATVTQEMEIVETYLSIEKVRFGDRLNFFMQIDDATKDAVIPRFLIQPLVENALKHGLNDMAKDGELKIEISLKGANILIAITDNGKPFPAELNLGYGLQSTYDKLTLLYGENYQVQIVSTPQKQIRIEIPAIYE